MPDYIRSADVRSVTPATALLSGDLFAAADGKVGYVEAQRGIPANERGLIRTSGLLSCAKASASDVIAAGDRIQYNLTTKLVSVLDFGQPASGSIVIGLAAEASGNGVASVTVDLNSHGGTPAWADQVNHLRVRATTAQVNAGLTLLPAIAGYRYRLVDVALIAIGGNAAGATSVDVRATQSASGVNLLAAAVAGLTQNTLLRAGATNAAILAGGVSFVANDANTAITLNATGTLTTATNVDVLLSYAIEPA